MIREFKPEIVPGGGRNFINRVDAQVMINNALRMNRRPSQFQDLTIISLTLVDFTDAQHNHQNAAGGGKLDHGLALNGLTDDDHTQYALLAGRSGGQTLIGGTDSGDDLLFNSTSNATKGTIAFGNLTTGLVFDETNTRVGIGKVPSVDLDVLDAVHAYSSRDLLRYALMGI